MRHRGTPSDVIVVSPRYNLHKSVNDDDLIEIGANLIVLLVHPTLSISIIEKRKRTKLLPKH